MTTSNWLTHDIYSSHFSAVDRDLVIYRNLVLKLALPVIGQPSTGLESALFQMANTVVAQTNDQCLA
jgi:hypothetical protein